MQETLPQRFVGYVRVSTDEQARSGLSIQAQRERLAAWATAFGYTLVDIVADEGASAKSLDRPGMQRILRMVERREVDGIVAAKLDRLTRSTRDLGDLADFDTLDAPHPATGPPPPDVPWPPPHYEWWNAQRSEGDTSWT